MAKIFIGIAKHNTYDKFIESMSIFLPSIKEDHEVEVYETEGKVLVDAQNEIAEQFLKSDKDYLLILEDDHCHHTKDMVTDLLNANTHVCAINYYSRHYGKLPTLLNKTGSEDFRKAYTQTTYTEGLHEVDLCGFGMTLIKREVFDILDEPYFQPNEYYIKLGKDVSNKATDQNFCDRLDKHGIKPIGCFNHVLTHRGVSKDNYINLRHKYIIDNIRNAEEVFTQRAIDILRKRQQNRRIE